MLPPFFLNSTALMLEEPTSRPTIDFDPIPNMCPPLLCGAGTLARDVFVYDCPAAFAAALGFRFGSTWLDFSSIHWSRRDFLKRQRLPSLNAGMVCSPTYL